LGLRNALTCRQVLSIGFVWAPVCTSTKSIVWIIVLCV